MKNLSKILGGISLIVMTLLIFSCNQEYAIENIQEDSTLETRARNGSQIYFINPTTGQDIGSGVQTLYAQKISGEWKRWPYKIEVQGVPYTLSVDFSLVSNTPIHDSIFNYMNIRIFAYFYYLCGNKRK